MCGSWFSFDTFLKFCISLQVYRITGYKFYSVTKDCISCLNISMMPAYAMLAKNCAESETLLV